MGYMLRSNPALIHARNLVKAGILGEIYSINMDMNHGYGGEPYNEYLRLFPGGIMFNLGCHLIDYIISDLGAPEKVASFLTSTADVPPDTMNNTMAVLQYPHAFAQIQICSKHLCGNTSDRRVLIEGTNGWLAIQPMECFSPESLQMQLCLNESRGGLPAGAKMTIKFPPLEDRYIEQLRELGEVVVNGKTPEYSYEHDYLGHKTTLQAASIIK